MTFVSRCYLEIEGPTIEEGIQACEKNNPEVLIIVFYDADKSNIINKAFVNNIEKFSKNYGYSFTKVNINKLINIKPEEIEKYFTKYYGNSIFLIPI